MRLFFVFLAPYLLSQFFRSFLAVIAPELKMELGLTDASLGAMSALFFATFALAQFGVGWALDTYGPRRSVPVIMLAAVAGSALIATAHAPILCYVGMALIGLGCSPIYMGALYVFGRLNGVSGLAMMASWLYGLGTLGNVMAATPLSLAAEAIGWRGSMLVIAVLVLATALLVLMLVRDPPRAAQTGPARGAVAELGQIVRLRPLWPLIPLMLTSYATIAAERGLWVGPYLAEVHGLEGTARGNGALLMALAMAAGALLYGVLDRWFASLKAICAVGAGICAVAFFALWVLPDASLETALACLAIAGASGGSYGVLMAHGRSFVPEALLGRGLTTMNFVFIGGTSLVQLASGPLVGWMRASGLPTANIYANLHLAFALVLVASVLVYLTAKDVRMDRRA